MLPIQATWLIFLPVGTIRKVVKPVEFSDGLAFPVGTLLAVDTQNAVFNHSTLPNPEVFDGFRYVTDRSLHFHKSSTRQTD
jgi:hypothetical protein